MKTAKLKRVPAPTPPPEPKLCVACSGFRAECMAPVGEDSAPMCWLCAHHVVDHGCSMQGASTAECECAPHEIYPGREPPTLDELIGDRQLREPSHADTTFEALREAVEKMTLAQRAELLSSVSAVTQRGSRRKSS